MMRTTVGVGSHPLITWHRADLVRCEPSHRFVTGFSHRSGISSATECERRPDLADSDHRLKPRPSPKVSGGGLPPYGFRRRIGTSTISIGIWVPAAPITCSVLRHPRWLIKSAECIMAQDVTSHGMVRLNLLPSAGMPAILGRWPALRNCSVTARSASGAGVVTTRRHYWPRSWSRSSICGFGCRGRTITARTGRRSTCASARPSGLQAMPSPMRSSPAITSWAAPRGAELLFGGSHRQSFSHGTADGGLRKAGPPSLPACRR